MARLRIITLVNGSSEFILVDPETGIVRDIFYGTYCGGYCFPNQQTEWASDLGEALWANNTTITDILINCEGSIDLSQIPNNIKEGFIGFISSAMISLGIGELYIDIQNDLTAMQSLYDNKDVIFNILGTCLMNTISVHSDNAEDVMSPYTADIKWANEGKMVTYSIRVNPDNALDAAQLEIEVGLLIAGAIYGPTEGIGLLLTIFGGLNTALSAFRGQYNDVFSDPWLQVKINDQPLYTRYLFYNDGIIEPQGVYELYELYNP